MGTADHHGPPHLRVHRPPAARPHQHRAQPLPTRPPEGFLLARSIDESLTLAGDVPEVMIIGGAQIYAAFLPRANRIHLTLIHHRFAGDTPSPPSTPPSWTQQSREDHEADERNPHAHSFLVLERQKADPAKD